ncbi:MAG TPA: nucleotidyl transferase AbiEii/AbiGii toxin family protein [Puia sp.]|jgi:hypothetical protein|nr:nucleotidyl transferase AbiEii/AbiGii toxin family protein [Puia sp.]
MSAPPEKIIIEEVASIKGISEPFVEKDWYVTQVIKKVSEITYEGFQIIFTGGTALSKAHNLILRFSEDVDFRVIAPSLRNESKSKQKKILSDFKETVIANLKTAFQINENKVFARNGNQFVALEIDYPTLYPRADALRPHILVEFTVTNLAIPAIHLPVSSFVCELTRQRPEVASIGCTNPVENASDKLSALTWRIPNRVRGQENDNPDIVRHIHDLSILSDYAIKHAAFRQLVIETIDSDDQRSSKISGLSLSAKFDIMLGILNRESEYEKEYERFVMGMSYGPDGSVPSFKIAVEKIQIMITHILQ